MTTKKGMTRTASNYEQDADPLRQWVNLTDEDIVNAMRDNGCEQIQHCYFLPNQKAALWAFARVIATKLKDKNDY